MKYLFHTLCLLLLSGCIAEDYLKPIVPNHILHANSAKIWLLNENSTKEKNNMPVWSPNKMTFTFFDDGEVFLQKFMHLGSAKGEKAKYSLGIHKERKDTTLSLYFEDGKEWLFKLKTISYHEINLIKIDAYQEPQGLVQLISYQKPF